MDFGKAGESDTVQGTRMIKIRDKRRRISIRVGRERKRRKNENDGKIRKKGEGKRCRQI